MSALHPPDSTPEPPLDPSAGGTADVPAAVGRDEANWAKHVGPLSLHSTPHGALNLNVDGRELAGPLQGFGKLWQKTYRVELTGVAISPQEVITTWKANYGAFWPDGHTFYAPLAGIQPGEVGLINANLPARLKLSTGVMVLYADDVSFTYMTPQGHPFAGWITFSADTTSDGATCAQVEVLMRAQDPAGELGLTLGGHRAENRMWAQTLRNLATHFGIAAPETRWTTTCVDKRRQWRRIGNLRHDALLHTLTHAVTAPVRASVMSRRRLPTAAAVTPSSPPRGADPMTTTEGTTVHATPSRTDRTTPTSDTTATLVLMAGLAITAVLTPIHGEAGTAAEIGARSEWVPIHVGQLFSYFLIAIGAVAYSMAPRRSGLARTATVFLSLGATLAALAHIVDGPVRVSMIDAGLADGAQLYDAMILMATWMIVPGYVFMGVGGALFAWTVAADAGGATRLVAVVVLVLSLIGSTAGWGAELLGVIPGAVFLAFTLSWIWMAVVLGRELGGSAAPETAAATRPAAGR